jgi:hypothetical protein
MISNRCSYHFGATIFFILFIILLAVHPNGALWTSCAEIGGLKVLRRGGWWCIILVKWR